MSLPISIAVLPFSNMSSDEQNQYICDGITEEIINALAKIAELRVTSRTSSFHYKSTDLSIPEIGRELDTELIVEGSVRFSKKDIRITARLIKAFGEVLLWSHSWDRKLKEVFQLQDEISLFIADKLRENFGHFEIEDQLVNPQTRSIEAYKNFLHGNHHFLKWNVEDITKAIDYFEKALNLDKNHAESYYGLAQCYTFLSGIGYIEAKPNLEKAKAYAQIAIKLNPEIPEAYFGMATNAFWNEWDFPASY